MLLDHGAVIYYSIYIFIYIGKLYVAVIELSEEKPGMGYPGIHGTRVYPWDFGGNRVPEANSTSSHLHHGLSHDGLPSLQETVQRGQLESGLHSSIDKLSRCPVYCFRAGKPLFPRQQQKQVVRRLYLCRRSIYRV